ncbi:NlpC/P60 family protein [Desulfosporosinus youngiae]|uniref:Cell wall-associated hydrolase, invasion-associated protein n=1 Tax=Desulfosporosinus youngiae DSM 17734 TaxID=768710 RepID=H5Y355_9FIRM|nr:NlpC/P60 family protein [Desulfosporosinus youngiae]EHQ88750.1 cell wall-associated hydrolase, invasion-associated protein [Desulfosporosinus youngiae DSM 17734]
MIRIPSLHKKVLISVIGAFLLVSLSLPVRADNLQEQLKKSQQEANQANGALNAQKEKVASATTQLVALKQSVEALNNSIAREQAKLNEEQKHLKDLENEQKKLEAKRQEYINSLGQVLRSNYEDGVNTYLAVLFEATSLSDFIDRADKIQMVVDNHSKLQKDIAELKETMNQQMDEIEQKKVSIQATIQDKSETQRAVQQVLDKQKAVLDELSKEEKAALNTSLSAKAKVNRIQQLIEQEKLEAAYAEQEKASGSVKQGSSSGVAGTVAVSGGAKQVLNYAAEFLGTKYVWGGTSPSGFDCSGYVQYVFRNNGITLSRTSEQQFNNGVSVKKSDLKPGDLVFFATYSSGASHVGIYTGNNTMIHSSSGGVSYDDMTNSYWSKRYLGARRVIAP